MSARLLIIAAVCFAASCNQAKAPSPAKPDDFALKLSVEAAAGAVQRVELPASALIAFQRSDRGDVRIFDANDRPLSLALIDDRSVGVTTTRLSPIPFTSQQQAGSDKPVSVRIERGGDRIAVDAGEAVGDPVENSVLLDARRLTGTAAAMRLDADIPSGRPVSVSIAASADLKNWQPIAEPVLFRADASGPVVGADRIDLSGIAVARQYLKLSWTGAPDIQINGALISTTGGPTSPRVKVTAKLPKSSDPHRIDFALNGGNVPAAIRLTMTGRDGVLPLRLLGRNATDEPWSLLALASLRQGAGDAKFELSGREQSHYRIEADQRSAGFSTPPAVTLEYEPIALIAGFNGNAPYRLAVGNSAAQPAIFPIAELTDKPGPFPPAKLSANTAGQPATVALDAPDSGPTQRSLWLWLSLLTGVAILAFVAYRLMKTNSSNNN
jgi:Protein of unknown function (DUF3999)